MKLPQILAGVLLAFMVASGCKCNHVGTRCSSNNQCVAGLVCASGVCQEPDAIDDGGTDGGPTGPLTRGTPCTPSDVCEQGLTCNASGTCQPTTLSDGGAIPDGGSYLADGGYCFNLQCQLADCPPSSPTRVTGSVYDPSGTVPLYNAQVFVPNGQLEGFDAGVTCDVCGTYTSGSPLVITLTGADGRFSLDNVPAGSNIPLVYQIGKWRRQVTLPSVPACQTTTLTNVDQQRMPRDRSEGDLPRMAISTGNADPFECLLYKMRINTSEMTPPSGGGYVHVYRQNGSNMDGGVPAGSALWTDGGTLLNYDVVLLPCEGAPNAKSGTAVQNIVDYTTRGGRLFATHYSYVWAQGGWPTAATWNLDQSHPADPFAFSAFVDSSFPKAQAFEQWLNNLSALDGGVGGTLPISEARHDVNGVNRDGGTFQWLYNTTFPNSAGHSVQHMTWNTPYVPAALPDGGTAPQCGRVVYSDFHVTANALSGGARIFPDVCLDATQAPLTPQEKALIFMLFDVTSCVQSDAVAPTTCRGANQSCFLQSDCCPGFSCMNPDTTPCTGEACSCGVWIN